MNRKAYRGRLITACASGVRFVDDALLVIEAGKLAHVGAFERGLLPRGAVIRDVRPDVLAPGFVDTHLHYPQTRVIGSASGPLLEWLEKTVFPEEARFRDDAYARAVAVELCDALVAAGTTTCSAFSSSDARATNVLFEALAERGLRGLVGLTLMDARCPEALRVDRAAAMEASAKLIDAWHGHDEGRLGFAVTPRFALSCSREMLDAAGALARSKGLVVQTHVAETPREGEVTLEAHPHARDYLDVYDQAGLLGERTILAHAIHLSEGEWARASERHVAIAHCPDSNFFLGSGRMSLAKAETHRIRVGLGSDVAAGRSFDLRRAMSYAFDNALCLDRRLDPSRLFELATLGGAQVLGLSDRIGSLEVGKEADVIVLGVPALATSKEDVLAAIAFRDAIPVREVLVRGRRLSGAA
jgi:guanine deaminase